MFQKPKPVASKTVKVNGKAKAKPAFGGKKAAPFGRNAAPPAKASATGPRKAQPGTPKKLDDEHAHLKASKHFAEERPAKNPAPKPKARPDGLAKVAADLSKRFI